MPNQASGQPLKSVIVEADAADGNYGSDTYGLSAVRFLIRRLSNVVPAAEITVTPSSVYSPLQIAQHLIDGSGMVGMSHDNAFDASTMWQTVGSPASHPPANGLPASPAWVRFNFARPTSFDSILIWNHNQADLTDRSFRKVRIYGSADGSLWHTLTSTATIELPRASGSPDFRPTEVPNILTQGKFKSVIIAADEVNGNYGSDTYGLSAVRFVLK